MEVSGGVFWNVRGAEYSYRVEGEPPELAEDGVAAPEPRSDGGGSPGEENADDGTDDEDAKTSTSTGCGTDGLADNDAHKHCRDIDDRVQDPRNLANLADNINVAVGSRYHDDLAPDDQQEGDVVDPGVDGVEVPEAKLGAVDEREQQGDDGDDGCGDPAGDAVTDDALVDDGDERLDQGDGRADTEQRNGQEPNDGEEVGAGHLREGERVGQEADGEGAQRLAVVDGVQVEEADDAEDDEAGDDLKGGVAEGDDEGVLDGIGEARAVRRVGGEVTETHTDGEEDLTAGGLPDLTAAQLLAVPLGKVVGDAASRVLERGGAAEQDDEHDNGQTHSEVDGAARDADAAEHAQPDAEPDEDGPADRLADHAGGLVARVLDDAVAVHDGGDGLGVLDDILHVELIATAVPREGAVERAAEVVHDPGQDGHVVADDHVAGEDDAQTGSLCAVVHVVEGGDDTGAVGLTQAELEQQHGDTQEEEGDEVGNEPLQTAVGEDDGGVAQDISETNGAALGEVSPAILSHGSIITWGDKKVDSRWRPG